MDGNKKVIALGFFDGVHRGHASLLVKAKESALKAGVVPSVITFDVHPENLLAKNSVPLITSPEDRAEIIRREFGINEVIVVHFDDNMRHMPWRDFIRWLIQDFSAVHFVAGHDFRFGYKGEGNPEKLLQFCAESGIGCDIMPKVTLYDITVSSTYIRTLLSEGNIARANEFLGHRHSLTDIVRFGYKLGSTIGAPTINMHFQENVLTPAYGVYAASLQIEDEPETHFAVTNIGVRPTVSGEGRVSVESFIFDFDRILYGKRVRLEFHEFLRPEIKFSGINELREQIETDSKRARDFFALRLT